jgi:hypothetical protein
MKLILVILAGVAQKKHLLYGAVAAAATFAYFSFVAKTSTAAQAVPLINNFYNLGYNISQGTFGFSSPVAS